MVIVPHEDDELNLAGGVIYSAAQSGMTVYCVFATNGNWFYPPELRIQEAIASLRNLGVSEKNIVFLGYSDGGSHGEHNLYTHRKNETIGLNQQQTMTCGMETHPEFAKMAYGRHQICSWKNFLDDLYNVILMYRPDTIIATDLDHHPDHRMCSIAFDIVINKILHEKRAYQPMILKGFAYNTTYNGINDFDQINLCSAKLNRQNLCNDAWDTDNPGYEWEKRIRMPIYEKCRERVLRKNPLYQSMCCHVSQGMMKRAKRIINSDMVFWQRRTDNLLFSGMITTSSGEAACLDDFCTLQIRDICKDSLQIENKVWVPDSSDAKKWCRCTFPIPQHIEKVILYGNVAHNDRVLRGVLSFSNGKTYPVKELRPWGMATEISFPPQDGITWIQFQICEQESPTAGIREWGIFSNEQGKIPAVMKILINDEFADRWYITKETKIKVDIYRTGIIGNVIWYWNGEICSLDDVQRFCLAHQSGVIRAEMEGSQKIYDEVIICPWTYRSAIGLWQCRLKNWITYKIEKYRERKYYHRAKRLGQLYSEEKNTMRL